jgi:hypothetical protein
MSGKKKWLGNQGILELHMAQKVLWTYTVGGYE